MRPNRWQDSEGGRLAISGIPADGLAWNYCCDAAYDGGADPKNGTEEEETASVTSISPA